MTDPYPTQPAQPAADYPTGPPVWSSEWPPGWHRDPRGRHEFRYWDGARWSDQVADRGVVSYDPFVDWAGGFAAARPAPDPRRRKRRRRRWLAFGLVLLLLAIGAGVFAYLVSQVDGAGTFAREIEEPGSTLVHSVHTTADTVLLIEVSPSDDGFDPVIGVSADESTVDEMGAFFNVEDPLPDDVFAGVVPEDTELVAVSDSAEQGEDEVTYVATPFGGDFEVLVTGAGSSVGAFDLVITIQPFDGADDEPTYLQELADQPFVEDYEPPRSPIEDILDDFIED